MMKRPSSTPMVVRSAKRRADVFSRGPVSSEVWSPDAEYTHPSGPRLPLAGRRSQKVACSRASSSTNHARLIFVQRMQGIREHAGIDREVFQDEHEATGQRVERRPVR